MVRTQIQLPERQYEQVRSLAHRERISMAEAIRRLIQRGLEPGRATTGPSGAAGLLGLSGIGRSGLQDLGREHDRYLAEDAAGDVRRDEA